MLSPIEAERRPIGANLTHVKMSVVCVRTALGSSSAECLHQPSAISWITRDPPIASRMAVTKHIPEHVWIDGQQPCGIAQRFGCGNAVIMLTSSGAQCHREFSSCQRD